LVLEIVVRDLALRPRHGRCDRDAHRVKIEPYGTPALAWRFAPGRSAFDIGAHDFALGATSGDPGKIDAA
jgi:hypothetical protein